MNPGHNLRINFGSTERYVFGNNGWLNTAAGVSTPQSRADTFCDRAGGNCISAGTLQWMAQRITALESGGGKAQFYWTTNNYRGVGSSVKGGGVCSCQYGDQRIGCAVYTKNQFGRQGNESCVAKTAQAECACYRTTGY
jgi:hypothetical protein